MLLFCIKSNSSKVGETHPPKADFDQLTLQIIKEFGFPHVIPYTVPYRTSHSSEAYEYEQQRKCVLCHMKTVLRCPDCPFVTPLCQTSKKDCHGNWHSEGHNQL